MDPQGPVTEVIETVNRRIDVLEELLAEPTDKRTLEEHLDVSRSTIDRAIQELQLFELVAFADGAYRVTTYGQLVVQEYREFERSHRILAEFRPFLQHAPASAFDFDFRHLADAELFVPEMGDPYAMINRHVSAIDSMDAERVLLPVTGLHAHEAAHEAIVHGDARGDVIVGSEVVETWQSNPQYVDLTEELIATGRFEIFLYDGEIPFLAGVFDEEMVQLGVVEDGEPRALVETESAAIRAWAERTLDEYQERATKLT
ncbi:hypothetical protein OB955_21785 [Halobacteria archaeon AArc-m2/3/4]|uniref:HTH domain-containing protein n=1 Tax=Natronoglomus mannanivorans TaxID=2979990 RepID=A0ABT2QK71_9EURY|nr:hypothetical protein [Halobacteria archaeon AArc-m2/3/4]